MELDDPCMPQQPVEARNYFLACYAASLVEGETILGRTIRSRTLRHYITDARKLFQRRRITTYYPDTIDYVDLIISALRNYEAIPDRRNMITDNMMWHLHKSACTAPADSDTAAMLDWFILGRYTGFRKSEWCQSTQTDYQRILEWPGQPSLAIIRSDFEFLDAHERLIKLTKTTDIDKIHYVRIRWRHQKNKENGEKIPFARDRTLPQFCPVLAAIRIAQRASRLNTPQHEPIGVFKHKNGQRRFITDKMVTHLLRQTASTVLNIKPGSPQLQLWSTHSIRVTAANILHREKMTDSFIQTRLRWKSTSFLMYLRNTIYAANQHSNALRISDSNLPPVHERSYREDEPHEIVTAPAA